MTCLFYALCHLWDARAYRHHIASENAGIRFNISYKPLDVEGSINKLARLNLIDARRFAGESGKHDAIPFLRALGKSEDMIIGLIPNGGKLWESRLDPCCAIILDSTLSSWTETIIEAFIRQVRFAVIA